MRVISAVLIALILALAMLSSGLAVGKITVDPNAPGVQRPVTPKDDIDKRLAQKITYDSGYKRLHVVADDIAKLSGVSIACGQNPKDWRVRDIPVVVCVKDMPLGKLLRAIADATHTRVASERVGDDPVRHYRIYRRSKEEQAIENLISARHEAKLAQLQWQWDALVAYGKSGKEISGVEKSLLPLAKLIASLGPDVKGKMLDGDMFCLRGSDPSYASAIAELQRTFWESRVEDAGEKARNVAAPTAKDTEAAAVGIKIFDEGEMGMTTLNWILSPSPAFEPGSSSSVSYHFGAAAALDGKGLDIPPYPKDPTISNPKDEIDNPAMVYMAKDKPQDWDHPLLKAKIDAEKPKDLKNATFADAMRALAKASGCNIVAEDFVSHIDYGYQNVNSVFAKDTTVADRLRGLEIRGFHIQYNWFFGEESKLLIGWASSNSSWMSGSWLDHHRNLLPEQYLIDLKRKLNGPGIQFDDAVGLSSMTTGSFHEWITDSRDLFCLSRVRPALNVAVWKLYDSLSAEDKALAKSDSGLRIAKLDPDLTTEFLRSSRMAQFPFVFEGKEELPGGVKIMLDQRATSDQKVIATMVMRVISRPAKGRSRQVKPGFGEGAFAAETISPALKLSLYSILIEYIVDGEKQTVDCLLIVPLPVYSREREAELLKAAATAQAKQQPVGVAK